MEIKHATLCIPVTKTHVLLGKKKVRWGAGKWNGFGGKIAAQETSEAAAIRELQEECGLVATQQDIEKVATLQFYFNETTPTFRMDTYFVHNWKGSPIESDEMLPQWHEREHIPYNAMWDGDRIWMKEIFDGKRFGAHVYFTVNGTPGTDPEIFDRIEYDDELLSGT